MIKLLTSIVIVLGLSANAAAQDNSLLPLEVGVGVEEGANAQLAVDFKTVLDHSSMCTMTVTQLNIATPLDDGLTGIPRPPIGVIDIKAEVMPLTVCLMATGPHRGALKLTIGETLPSVTVGYYHLILNGDSYGYVELNQFEANLVEFSDIPQ